MNKQEAPAIRQATILVVDDAKENLTLIGELLKPHYAVRVASSGQKALEIAGSTPRPDLILLDVMMPDVDGHRVLAALRKNPSTSDIPVIFVTSLNADEDEEQGLAEGAVDYITKPIHPPILLARVQTHLALKRSRDQLKSQNSLLEAKVQERTDALKHALERAEAAHGSLRKTYFGMLRSFGELAELRGGALGAHSQRVADLTRQVALRFGMNDEEIQEAFIAALLHDIGMIGFPDGLSGKSVAHMTRDELLLYRKHSAIGAKVIEKIETMENVSKIIQHHHEHYDGSGFPDGLSGLEIPVASRIILAASDYDSLRQGRLTAQPMTSRQSCKYLLDECGRRYDPLVIELIEPLLAYDSSFEVDEIRVEARHIQEGMVLSRDIGHPDGFLLLSSGTVMARRTIDQLVDVQKRSGAPLEIFVHRRFPLG